MNRLELIKNKEFRPMLAHKVGKEIDFTDKVFIQPKLDGIRCYITKDGAFTRNGKEIKNVKHINEALISLFEFHPDFILDGELYNHELHDDFNKIVSLVRKQTPTEDDIEASKELIQFHWYDIVTEEQQEQRTFRIRQMYEFFFKFSTVIRYVETIEVPSIDQVNDLHLYYRHADYEGSIVRLNGQYKVNGRSRDLLKVKDWQDTEFTITDYVEGKGKFAGGIGKWLGS